MNIEKKQKLLFLLRQYKVDKKTSKWFDRVYTGEKTFNNKVKKMVKEVFPNAYKFKKINVRYLGDCFHVYDIDGNKLAQVHKVNAGFAQSQNVPEGMMIQFKKK